MVYSSCIFLWGFAGWYFLLLCSFFLFFVSCFSFLAGIFFPDGFYWPQGWLKNSFKERFSPFVLTCSQRSCFERVCYHFSLMAFWAFPGIFARNSPPYLHCIKSFQYGKVAFFFDKAEAGFQFCGHVTQSEYAKISDFIKPAG